MNVMSSLGVSVYSGLVALVISRSLYAFSFVGASRYL